MSGLPKILVGLASGAIFGFGLSISGMLDPARVRGFLDVGGHFDPSLAFVLAGAVAVSAVGYLLSRRLPRPLLGGEFQIPSRKTIDRRLVLGAAIFGVGWGMSGLCPGPAIASLALGLVPTLVFSAMMLAGILIYDNWKGAPRPEPSRQDANAQI
ncbi:MAG: YeeE/YedE family protein [Methylocella sp.]